MKPKNQDMLVLDYHRALGQTLVVLTDDGAYETINLMSARRYATENKARNPRIYQRPKVEEKTWRLIPPAIEDLDNPPDLLNFVRWKVMSSPRSQPWKAIWQLHTLGKEGLRFAVATQTCTYLDRAYGRLLPNHIGNLTQDQRLEIIDEAIVLAKKDRRP